MLWTIALILIVFWILGLISSYTLGGWVHALLIIGVIMLLVNFFRSKPGSHTP